MTIVDAADGGGLRAVVTFEGAGPAPMRPTLWTHRKTLRRPSRHAWAIAVAGAVGWCLWDAGIGRQHVTNAGGFGLMARFFGAAVRPRVGAAFLADVARDAAVTVSYAAIATLLSLVIGFLGAAFLSERLRSTQLASNPRTSPVWRRALRFPTRSLISVPRGVHEAVWALLLINVLGRDPLVAVLAIGIPFGATTAKVYAELIDESPRGTYALLRTSGGSRIGSFLYGVGPLVSRDFLTYGFYRFECAMRSAVVLGMIGAGGIGFQLGISFQGLQYHEMWTCLYAIIILGILAEQWSAALRRTSSRVTLRRSLAAAICLLGASWWFLRVRPWNLWSPRTRTLGHRLVLEMLPPRLPKGGSRALLSAVRESLQMSFLAIVIAIVLAVPLAYAGTRWRRSPSRNVPARFLALAIRSIPPTVWALLVLFVVLPGVLPGAIALGIYTAGVLARLFGDVLENSTNDARDHLQSGGATATSASLYATLPTIAPVWTSLALYRWEVAARESVVVGVVGAGGLGRLLSAQINAFSFAALSTTLVSIIVLTIVVDRVSQSARRALR